MPYLKELESAKNQLQEDPENRQFWWYVGPRIKNNEDILITTVEIAKLIGRRKDNVLRAARKALTELYGPEHIKKFQVVYREHNNRDRPCLRLFRREA